MRAASLLSSCDRDLPHLPVPQPTPKGQIPLIEAVKTRNVKFVDALIQVRACVCPLSVCMHMCAGDAAHASYSRASLTDAFIVHTERSMVPKLP